MKRTPAPESWPASASADETATPHVAIRVALVLVAIAVVVIGLDPWRPSPAPPNAPPEDFSAARAFTTVEAVARGPHPTGHPAQEPIRAWLVAMLESLGLSVEVQEHLVIGDEGLPEQHPDPVPAGWVEAVRVHNIIARLPAHRSGLASTEARSSSPSREGRHAVMLSAHYDARGASPGAADDGSAIAIILEVLRVLEQVPDRAREVIVLLTDAEELGLDGARAFATAHPAAAEVAVTINLEARGNGGRSRMFETTAGNAAWIDAYDRSGAWSAADSLSASIYRRMPRDTDLTVLRQVGIAGYNFAFIRGLEHYHTPLDTPANLDRGTLQEQGDAVLALARTLVRGTLPATETADAMYFSLAGETWVLSAGMGRALAILALLLALGTLAQRITLGAVTPGAIARALVAGSVTSIAAAATIHFIAAFVTGALHEGWTHPSPLTAHTLSALAALVLFGVTLLLVIWRQLRMRLRSRDDAQIARVAFGVGSAGAIVLASAMLLPLAAPLLAAVVPGGVVSRARWLPLFAGLVALGTFVAIANRPGVPLASSIHYFADAESRSAHWVTFDPRPGEFGKAVMRLGDDAPRRLAANLAEDPSLRESFLALRGGHRHDDADFLFAKGAPYERQPEVTARVTTLSREESTSVHRLELAVPEGAMALDVIAEGEWSDVEILDGARWRPLAESLTRFRLIAPPREVVLRVRTAGDREPAGAVVAMRDGIPSVGGADGAERGAGEMPSEGDRTFVRSRFGG